MIDDFRLLKVPAFWVLEEINNQQSKI